MLSEEAEKVKGGKAADLRLRLIGVRNADDDPSAGAGPNSIQELGFFLSPFLARMRISAHAPTN